jgi:lysozyme family protein
VPKIVVVLLSAVLTATAVTVPVAVAADTRGTPAKVKVLKKGSRGAAVTALQRRLGVAADGVFGRQTRAAVKRFQRRNGLVADGVVGPATLAALGLSAVALQQRVAMPDALARIATCESGGDPRAVSSDGRYRGKYQFSKATWKAMGGSGDPAKAPEAEQDKRARMLYKQSGPRPWPFCARKLGLIKKR